MLSIILEQSSDIFTVFLMLNSNVLLIGEKISDFHGFPTAAFCIFINEKYLVKFFGYNEA